MPRKRRDVRGGLEAKGFQAEEDRKHIHFVYIDLHGKITTARTMMSHGASGDDIGDNLLGQMARQIGLTRKQFLDLIDCPLTLESFDAIVKKMEVDTSH